MKNEYWMVVGNIGSGKSSLTKMLAGDLDYRYMEEPYMQNPYLELSYQNPQRWCFHSQMYFLLKHFEQQITIKGMLNENSLLKDCSIYEAKEVFSRNYYESGLMDQREWRVFEEYYDILVKQLSTPNLMIYLNCKPEISLKRIKNRNRAFEIDIEINYLNRLKKLYDDFFNGWAYRKIEIKNDCIDFVNCPKDFKDVKERILDYINKR